MEKEIRKLNMMEEVRLMDEEDPKKKSKFDDEDEDDVYRSPKAVLAKNERKTKSKSIKK